MTEKITFTTFMSFVLANGAARMTQVRKALSMYASEYRFASWYLELRVPIAECFKGAGTASLDRALSRIADERKRESHEEVVAGLKRWIGKKKISSFAVSSKTWSAAGLTVSVNPEHGLVINGERYVVKLYMKDARPTQRSLAPLLHLLHETHGDVAKVMILDCRRGKQYTLSKKVKDMDKFLEAEARAFVSLWESLAVA